LYCCENNQRFGSPSALEAATPVPDCPVIADHQ
jgi:hypothetical protein